MNSLCCRVGVLYIVLFLLFSVFHIMCVPWYVVTTVVSSTMTWHCIVSCLPCSLHSNVVYLCSSFVTRERASNIEASLYVGLKNRHGHWLWYMSTGRKNGLV